MNAKERVLSSLDHRGYDRIPIKHCGTPEIDAELRAYFGVDTYEELLAKVGDDFRSVDPEYCGPQLRTFPDGSWEGIWGERYNNVSFGHGTYPEAVYLPYAGVTSVKQLEGFPEPTPDWYDCSTIREQCLRHKEYAVYTGDAGVPDFLNGIGRCRGVEQVLIDVATEDPVFLELVERRFRFYYGLTERILQAADGLIDVVWTGEDLGTQNGLTISPRSFERLFAEKYRALFAMIHEYGARVFMHSCGSVRRIIPRLIELGLDVLDVVQVSAAQMGIKELRDEFGNRLAFCGSMCVQSILPHGTIDEVRREVEMRLELFPDGGLILGPTHAIQVGTPVENIVAMYQTAGGCRL